MSRNYDIKKVLPSPGSTFFIVFLRIPSRKYRIHQSLRILFLGFIDDIIGNSAFYYSSLIQYQNPVAEHLDKGQIMTDKNKRQPLLLFQVFQKLHDLFLYGYIQGTGCLITLFSTSAFFIPRFLRLSPIPSPSVLLGSKEPTGF